MTQLSPKEKAWELFKAFQLPAWLSNRETLKCCKICIEEIMKAEKVLYFNINIELQVLFRFYEETTSYTYWQEVLIELDKL